MLLLLYATTTALTSLSANGVEMNRVVVLCSIVVVVVIIIVVVVCDYYSSDVTIS